MLAPLRGAEDVVAPGLMPGSTLTRDNLDAGAYSEWVDGEEKVIMGDGREFSPEWLIWTEKSTPGHSGRAFGKSDKAGIRHLRIGFVSPMPIGTVLAKGGGQLSVLKPGATYPGNLGDDAEWIPAQRLVDGKVSSAPVAINQTVAWVLPPGTSSQALRFTHESTTTDPKYEGQIGGVLVLAERFENVAPSATVAALSGNERAGKINNEIADIWSAWENMENSKQPGDAPLISASHPEWVLLVWREPVTLRGLVALFAGFGSADVQVFTGPDSIHPRDGAESDWKTVGEYEKLRNGYPVQLWPNWLGFPKDVTTRAVRVRMTSVSEEGHPHLKGRGLDGRRVWLDELIALSPLGDKPLQDRVVVTPPSEDLKPPIPVKFVLNEPGFVTLVVEKHDGQRVRNLVSETYFPAGKNVVFWDGTDDLTRDTDAAKHGVYHIPARLVEPGEFRVRGLTRGAIEPRYEFSVYSAGSPAWNTPDKTGGWLSNHSPPQAAVFVPGAKTPSGKALVFLGSYVSEGRDGVAWVDMEGRKQGGKTWVGGNWTGAPYMAFDAGSKAVAGNHIYVGSVWETGKGTGRAELRLTALTSGEDKPVLKFEFDAANPKKMGDEIAGIAAFDGIVVVSLPQRKELLFADAASGKKLGAFPLEGARGLAFDTQGRLYVVAGKQVLRFERAQDPTQMPAAEVLVSKDLEEPQQIALDSGGNLYVSDWGDSHQVKVFSSAPHPAPQLSWWDQVKGAISKPAPPEIKPGEYPLVQAIGHPGKPKAGPYDPLHMNHPYGLTVDSDNRLWVAEMDFLPKRVSVWTPEGGLARAFYGPSKYGGGGALDSADKNVFYYGEEDHGAMAFKLDWDRGTSELASVYYRPEPSDMKLAFRSAAPEVAFAREGKRYFTNCYNSSPVSGHNTAFLFLERDGVARPAAAMGRANDWETLKAGEFLALWPEGLDPASKDASKNETYFSWSDANEDAQVQPGEVLILKGAAGGITVMPDLAFCFARQAGRTVRYAPTGFSSAGVPKYDLKTPQVLAEDVTGAASSGGNQALNSPDGWTVVTLGIAPFAQQSLSGAKDGKPMWSYPSVWPGLHAAHEAPAPDRPGQLIGTTRLLGGLFEAEGSDAGPLWAVNGNLGTVYVFTADGLFVATLFEDGRLAKPWAMPAAARGMSLEGITLHEENFWPTISRTSDGKIYLVDGGRSSIVSLKGMETIKRLPDSSVTVTAADLGRAQEYQTQEETLRQRDQGNGVLEVVMLPVAPVVDGQFEDWKSSAWVDIDKRGVKANFNSNSKPYNITGSVAVSGDRLYAAYQTENPKLIENSGETPAALFKTGGALDLMIGANPSADPKRRDAVAGDVRLIVALVKGAPKAMLYRAVVPGTLDSAKIPFSSPWRTITFDQVADISSQVRFAEKDGNFEFSVPLTVLGINPKPGLRLKGDIGVLRGNAVQTTARVYWGNKATSITSDVPSEAFLAPGLWGNFEFKPTK